MHQLVLPLAVMAITVAVALGLLVFFRHLLKLRVDLAPEVVNPVSATKVDSRAAPPTLARRDLAA